MTKLLYIGPPSEFSGDRKFETEKLLPYLKPLLSGVSCAVKICEDMLLTQIELQCRSKEITGVITNNVSILKRLLDWKDNRKQPSLDSYQGSIFKHGGIEYLIINPLNHLIGVNHAPFVFKRFISKLASPNSWLSSPEFNWSIIDARNIDEAYSYLESSFAVATDIETFSDPLSIRCIGFTGISLQNGSIHTKSYVLPIDSDWAMAWCRKLVSTTPPKIFQNGKYDNAYLSMFRSPVHNWLWDTATMFHCWYSELPKDLAFLNSFFVRESMYWKDLADTNDLQEYYRYNALDTWATANVFMAWMLEAPQFAKSNYLLEFPLNFPCHMSEMIGIKRDMVELESRNKIETEKIESNQRRLSVMTGVEGFNSNSPVQMKALMKAFGLGDVSSTDEKSLKKFALRHPINSRIINTVLELRKSRKLVSTYLTAGKEYRGRILYALNPHGTDTSRLASRESHFWCGLQIQNITRGESVKSTLVADDGFRIAESDLEQAESRDTGYASGEEKLIEAVESPRDFHSINASAFFGVSYDSIYDDVSRKTKDKKLRDLAKRVNHGANYLMGAGVLVDTMGEDKVYEARRLLELPAGMTLKAIAEHLLAQFHATYPKLSQVFYPWIISEVTTKKMLTGPQGWTRYCFGNPSKNKSDLNAYVAHYPQHINAQTLNKAFMRVFYEIAMHPSYRLHFKLCAQIHDSILFQFRVGHEYLVDMVKERMEIPVTIKGADGVVRTFTVPAASKAGPDGKGALRWSDIE